MTNINELLEKIEHLAHTPDYVLTFSEQATPLIQAFREQVRKEARDEFEEAIYKHIDTISEESEKFREDTFRSVGYSVRISAIRETLNILSQLPTI